MELIFVYSPKLRGVTHSSIMREQRLLPPIRALNLGWLGQAEADKTISQEVAGA